MCDEGCNVARNSQGKNGPQDDALAVNQLPSAPPDLGDEDPTYVTGEYDDEETIATDEDKMQASAPTVSMPVISAVSMEREVEELDLDGGDIDEDDHDEPTRVVKPALGELKVPNPGEVAAMTKSARAEQAKKSDQPLVAGAPDSADSKTAADHDAGSGHATAESLADALNDGYERHGSQGPGTTDSLVPKVAAGVAALGVIALLLGLRKRRKRRRLAREQEALEG